jgi:hypothetical protein
MNIVVKIENIMRCKICKNANHEFAEKRFLFVKNFTKINQISSKKSKEKDHNF